MNRPMCIVPTSLPDLLAYWLGEMPEVAGADLEDHLFGCEACSARLARVANLAAAIRHEFRGGHVASVVPAPFISRLKTAGLRVREYRIQPGGSVHCTIAPEDDLVVSYLHASLGGIRRLDIVIDEGDGGPPLRLEDVAFDPASEEVAMIPVAAELRALGTASQRVELIAVGDAAESVIGRYTFNHSPFGQKAD